MSACVAIETAHQFSEKRPDMHKHTDFHYRSQLALNEQIRIVNKSQAQSRRAAQRIFPSSDSILMSS